MKRGFSAAMQAPADRAAGAFLPSPRRWRTSLWRPLQAVLGFVSPNRRREQAQEQLIDGMADRIARLEISLLREQQDRRQQALRAGQAEEAVIRLQASLDQLRQDKPASCPDMAVTRQANLPLFTENL